MTESRSYLVPSSLLRITMASPLPCCALLLDIASLCIIFKENLSGQGFSRVSQSFGISRKEENGRTPQAWAFPMSHEREKERKTEPVKAEF